MKKKIISLLTLGIFITIIGGFIFTFSSYSQKQPALKYIKGGAVILTFDDKYITDWMNADKILKKYKWKATFFITQFDTISPKEIENLLYLQTQGHEIGFHGTHHVNGLKYLRKHSMKDYINFEILPAFTAMKNKGFMIKSFAYPYGARNENLDNELLKYFQILRGTTSGERLLFLQNNFATGKQIVFGLGIDESYHHKIDYLLKELKYANSKNKIVIFYGHHVSTKGKLTKEQRYTTTIKRLETICSYVRSHNMRFMTIRELYKTNNEVK